MPLKQLHYILIIFITLYKIIESSLLMNLLAELCLIDDGVMVYIKQLKQKKNYRFDKRQKLLHRLPIKISLTGQPILIGTTTVQKSEMLAQLLSEYKLVYQILNAKPENVQRESEIIAQAGKRNSITIATNMAGRGTDIILGGNIAFKIQKTLYNILTLLKSYKLSKKKIFSYNF